MTELLKSYKLHLMLLGGWPKIQTLDDNDKQKQDIIVGSCFFIFNPPIFREVI